MKASELLKTEHVCIHCDNDPGTKNESSIIWKGFLDQDTGEKCCNNCKDLHYSLKFQNPELRGLYSEIPLTIQSPKTTTVSGIKKGERTPLSGGNGKVTRADVIHEDLFIECKLRAKHTVVSLWDDTAKLAKDEGKTPVIALCEKNRPGFWVMVHSSDLGKLNKIK